MASSNAGTLDYADATAFNRWLIPIAAVLVHICIGSVTHGARSTDQSRLNSPMRRGGLVLPIPRSPRLWFSWA